MLVFVSFFSPFSSVPVLALSHRRRTRRICQIETKSQNYSLPPTYQEVICYDTSCCQDGCCPWYINIFGIIVILVIFIVTLKIIVSCWQKYCNEPETDDNRSQENILMSANTSRWASRDGVQNYGSNTSTVPSLPVHKREDYERPPTYEEAIRLPRID